MKKIFALSFFLFLSFSVNAEDYSCQLFNLKAPEPIKQAIDYDFFIDLYKDETLVIWPSRTLGEAKTSVIRGEPDLYKVHVGQVVEQSYFYISSETNFNMLDEYVEEMSKRHELDQDKTQALKEKLDQEFDNKTINGTHVALGQVQGFLSCEKR